MQDPVEDKQATIAVKRKKVSVWRLGLGLLLLLGGLGNLISKPEGDLQPSNQTQWMSYYFVTFLFLAIGALLIVLGTRPVWRRPAE